MFNITMPSRTIVQCGLAALLTVAILSWLHIRPLGILFLVLLFTWLYKTRCNIQIVVPSELQDKYRRFKELSQYYRQNHPTMFCVAASAALLAFAVTGHLITGTVFTLICLVAAAIISSKYKFKMIRIERKDFAWADRISHDPELEDEFMLEANESNLHVLECASDLAGLNTPTDPARNGDENEKSDEIPAELLFTDTVPEITENSTDDEQDDLLPNVDKSKALTEADDANNKEISSISRNSNATNDRIQFNKRHFKYDSTLSDTSSSSEESLSKGLHFPDHTEVDGAAATTSTISRYDIEESLSKELQFPDHSEVDGAAATTSTISRYEADDSPAKNILPNFMAGILQRMRNAGKQIVVSSSPAIINPTDTKHIINPSEQYVDNDSSEDDFEILDSGDFK